MKHWILNWIWNHPAFKGFREAEFRAASIDAFKKAQADVLETFQDDAKEAAKEIAAKQISDLLSVVDEKAIIAQDKRGLIYIGGELAPDERLSALKSEAELFMQSELWKVLCENPKRLAERAMFIDGESIESMQKGRAMLYLLSTQQNIINILRKWEKK